MKRVYLCLCIFFSVLLISGCQKGNSGEEQPSATVTSTVTENPLPTVTEEVTPAPKFEGVTLNWCLPDIFRSEDLEESAARINAVLDSLGRDYHISFSVADLFTYPNSVPQNGVDIAGFGNTDFRTVVAKGYFLPLSNFLSDTELYKHYGEKLWESVSIDGTVYSVPNTGGYILDGPLFVFNRKYFSEEQADEVVLSLNELEPVLVELRDRNVDCPLYFNHSAQSMLPLMGSYERDNIIYSAGGTISSLTESEEYRDVLDTLNRYAMQGLAKGPIMNNLIGTNRDELLEAYNSVQKAGTAVDLDSRLDYGIMITSGWQGFCEDDVIIRKAPHVIAWTPLCFSPGLWSSSENPDLAFAFLSDFYLNTELQGFFFEPFEEGQSMTLMERFEEHLTQTSLIGTREFYMRDGDKANVNVPLDKDVMRFACPGFIPDGVTNGELSSSVNALWSDYNCIWMLPEIDYFMNQYREKMKGTGIDSVVEEVRKQYNEWNSRQ